MVSSSYIICLVMYIVFIFYEKSNNEFNSLHTIKDVYINYSFFITLHLLYIQVVIINIVIIENFSPFFTIINQNQILTISQNCILSIYIIIIISSAKKERWSMCTVRLDFCELYIIC